MNYLAHIFLSGDNQQIRIGNFIGDAVKGNKYNGYPEDIRTGIILHRAIDDFTDHNETVRCAIALLKPEFGRYSAILSDIFFDHFLAIDFKRYAGVSLSRYCRGFYWALYRERNMLPDSIRNFLWHFIGTNRLKKYSKLEGIERALEIMVRYKNLKVDPKEAISFLKLHYEELRSFFEQFFPLLQQFATQKLGQLLSERVKSDENTSMA